MPYTDPEKARANRNRPEIRAREKERLSRQYQERKEILAERRKARYLANKEAELARNRAWSDKNRERHRELCRRWSKENPVEARALVARRRAVKKSADGVYTAADVRMLMDRQSGLCAHCKTDITTRFEVDHIHPLSRGGSNWPVNLQLLCMPCNRSKSCKLPDEWQKRHATQECRE